MIRTFQSLRAIDPGFTDPAHIQMLRVSISRSAYPSSIARYGCSTTSGPARRELAGVQSVGFGTRLPMVGNGPTGPFSLEDKPGRRAACARVSLHVAPTSSRHSARRCLPAGTSSGPTITGDRQVVIVSESIARREWGSPAAAFGKRLRRNAKSPWLEVIGVAGDIRHDGLEQPAPDTIYMTSSRRPCALHEPRCVLLHPQ